MNLFYNKATDFLYSALFAVVPSLSEINTAECPCVLCHVEMDRDNCLHHLLLNGALSQDRAGALVQLENYSCAGAIPCITVPDNKHCPTGDQFPPGLPLKTENVLTWCFLKQTCKL